MMNKLNKDTTNKNSIVHNKYWFRSKQNIYLLLESISIRGCNRIVRAKSQFVRCLWISYLLFTSLFLIISIKRLASEYLTYSVNIQTYVDMDNPSHFPSVTFCNHQPFSQYAYQLWRQNVVISPTKFNTLLRQSADRYLNQSQALNQPFPPEAALYAFVFDTVKMYYQNLDWPRPKQMGHQRNQSIYMCLFRYSGENLVIGGPGCHDHMITISVRSHPHYFNCHTVEVRKEYTQNVQELGLIVWLGPRENYDVRYRQAFLLDLFEQAHGLRVAIHEPNQLANLESHGIQIEPGRMNELNFDAIKSVHVQSPQKPCIQNPTQSYQDLDRSFGYEFELCLNTHLQHLLVAQCHCIYAYLPRVKLPSPTLSYCGRIVNSVNQTLNTTDIVKRKICVHNMLSQSATWKKSFEESGLCLRRCESVNYASTVSVTTWRSTQWQLQWSQQTSADLDNLDSATKHKQDQFKMLKAYFQKENLSSVSLRNDYGDNEGLTGTYGFNDRYTYVLVKRKSNDTIVKAENLVLTFNALVSRIGGLCSLYIGMTFAVLIELIEFIYTLLLPSGKKGEIDQAEFKLKHLNAQDSFDSNKLGINNNNNNNNNNNCNYDYNNVTCKTITSPNITTSTVSPVNITGNVNMEKTNNEIRE